MAEKLSSGPKASHDLTRTGSGLSRGPNLRKKAVAAPWSSTFPAPQATLDLDFANDRGFVRGVGQGRSMDAVTFTRASTGTFVNSTGLLQDATNGVPRFDWASTAQKPQNLLTYSQDFNNAVWFVKTNLTLTANSINAPDGTLTAYKIEATASATTTFARAVFAPSTQQIFSVYVKKGSGATDANRFNLRNSTTSTNIQQFTFNYDTGNISYSAGAGSGATATNVGDGWWRIVAPLTSGISAGNSLALNLLFQGSSETAGEFAYIWGAQLETGTSASAYLEVQGFIPTNTPLAANPTCNGLLIEESRANRLLWCRDATNAAWVKTDVTAAKDQTGIDGVASAASSLTASADNGTCIQTITLGSGSRTGSVYLKRITGTGNVQVTLDGSTYSTVDLSASEWRRIVLSGTVTNPTVGIRLATNGDAVAMDYGQIEDGAFATSPILTTTASVTRSADVATMQSINFSTLYNQDEGTMFLETNSPVPDLNRFMLGWGTSNQNYIGMLYRAGINNSDTYVVAGTSLVFGTSQTVSPNQQMKACIGYKLYNYASCLNGLIALSTSSQPTPSFSNPTLYFGTSPFQTSTIKTCVIKSVKYFPKRFNDNILVDFTR